MHNIAWHRILNTGLSPIKCTREDRTMTKSIVGIRYDDETGGAIMSSQSLESQVYEQVI